ncbi:hypothetical protein C9374_013712 [Naegleria lovaniensis]|uniref:SKP1 component dimerisation domain-containing protein n=1 Tax=Naegleria lovaniensis TaxID=51637 RepID=A0AA88KBL2_NAELO|nr:uncharacterized protein C9374_013712 [Naegleria lovaniensis]KAG2372648.1 hypothetical protein C9374_013712 [Naegleria lovaniensis]
MTQALREYIPTPIYEFSKQLNHSEVVSLIMTSNLYNAMRLLDLFCAKFAEQIRGKSPEQLRDMFGLQNDKEALPSSPTTSTTTTTSSAPTMSGTKSNSQLPQPPSSSAKSSLKETLKTIGISVGVSVLMITLYHQFYMSKTVEDVENVRSYIAKIKAPLNTILEKTKSIGVSSLFQKTK